MSTLFFGQCFHPKLAWLNPPKQMAMEFRIVIGILLGILFLNGNSHQKSKLLRPEICLKNMQRWCDKLALKRSLNLMILLVKLHNLANFINQIVAGHKKNIISNLFLPFLTHQNSMYNYKTYLLNQKVVNLALEFWPAFCHFTPQPAQLY